MPEIKTLNEKKIMKDWIPKIKTLNEEKMKAWILKIRKHKPISQSKKQGFKNHIFIIANICI